MSNNTNQLMKQIRIRLERGEDINFISLKEGIPVINIQKAFKLGQYGTQSQPISR